MQTKVAILFLVILLLTACGPTVVEEPYNRATGTQPLPANFLTTEDNVKIAYTYHDKGPEAALLLHQLNSNKESYAQFAALLNSKGYTTIAIDFRGHGQSELDVNSFSDQDFLNMEKDIDAAALLVKQQGKELTAIVGASIGANLALRYGVVHEIPKIVLLSPGITYHGITVLDAAKNIRTEVMMVASGDDQYSLKTVKSLHDIMLGRDTVIFLENAGHGTEILEKKTDVQYNIVEFIQKSEL